MVADAAGGGLRREKVAARGLEELQHRLVFERRRIREIDHHLRSRHGFLEALAGDGVDAGIGRGGDKLVPSLAQDSHDLRADAAGAADDDDLHRSPPDWARGNQSSFAEAPRLFQGTALLLPVHSTPKPSAAATVTADALQGSSTAVTSRLQRRCELRYVRGRPNACQAA